MEWDQTAPFSPKDGVGADHTLQAKTPALSKVLIQDMSTQAQCLRSCQCDCRQRSGRFQATERMDLNINIILIASLEQRFSFLPSTTVF